MGRGDLSPAKAPIPGGWSATMRPMIASTEQQRQAGLQALRLDRLFETAFDDLTRLAAETFGVPMSTISIVDGERQWFKSKVGLDVDETPRAWAFCAQAILNPDSFLVVEDAAEDERFAGNPLVTGVPAVRFYAAAPLKLSSGHAIGALCVMDTRPHRAVEREKLEQLRFMAAQVVATLEARQAARAAA